MGKWTFVKKLVPKYSDDRSAKVHERAAQFANLSAKELGLKYAAVKRRKEEVEEEEKKINFELEAISEAFLDWMDENDMASVKIDDGTVFYEQPDVYVNVTNAETLNEFIKKKRMQWLYSVHPSKLKGYVKELIETEVKEKGAKLEKVLPPGLSIFFKNKIVMRGSKDAESE